MPASFVVYIDESGDEGFVFNEDGSGSSRWFVLGAVITRKTADLETVKLVDTLRQMFKWERKPLHFRKMKHEHRLPYIHLIAKSKVRVLAVAVHKPSLKEPETFQHKSMLYHYATRHLLERVSWCCRDHRREGEGDGTAEIVFSHRASTSYPEMTAYFQLLQKKSDVGDVRIDWSVVKPDTVRAVNHDQLMGLQIADACASAFYYGVQVNPQGFNEPRYATMLRPVVYAHKGRRLGNGLKLWPREADDLVAHAHELSWIADVYQ
ncbi:MAG: DUF3800 domain-containing protein [Phycisphaeraceae bacterium]|nr:DUF3800 domain-containing protein [Phycisphaeraceae bacterium]